MSKKKINIKFKKILNDLKRRPEDAASDLGITKKEIIEILDGKRKLKFDLILIITKCFKFANYVF